MCYHGYKINKFVYDELVSWRGGGVGLLEDRYVSLYWDSKLKFESKQNIWGREHSVDNISYFNICWRWIFQYLGRTERIYFSSFIPTHCHGHFCTQTENWNWYCTYKGVVQVLYTVQKEELSDSISFERCPALTAGPIVTNSIPIVCWYVPVYGTVYNTGMEMLK